MNRSIAIDPRRCTGCDECRRACGEGHAKAGRQREPRLALVEGDVNAALACHHCEGAPCAKVCPTASIGRGEDGCVRIDEHQCIGCKLCALACPFGAIRMGGTGIAGVAGTAYPHCDLPEELHPLLRWQIGVAQVAVKCDLCERDPRGPRCVEACLTNALRLVVSDDANGEALAKRVLAGRADLAALEPGEGDDRR